jgi:hypothetical protein
MVTVSARAAASDVHSRQLMHWATRTFRLVATAMFIGQSRLQRLQLMQLEARRWMVKIRILLNKPSSAP